MKDPLSFNEGPDLLDRVLGLAPLPRPDPWFTARTLARCRSEQEEKPTGLRWMSLWTRWALPVAALVFLGGLGLQQAHRVQTLQTHQQERAQEAFEVVASVDDDPDSSSQDNSL